MLAACQPLVDRFQQRVAAAVLQFFQPRVDAPHSRQAGGGNCPFLEGEQPIARRRTRIGGVGPTLQRGRRRAEHDRNAARVGAEDGNIARRIAHAILLLERGVVLFVDNDQAEVGHRGEHRQPGAEHDARRAVESGLPVARARRLGQFAVQTGQLRLGKARRDARFELRRQVDFRHQEQRLLSSRQRALDQPQVDLGLTAAGDAVQQMGAKAGTGGNGVQRHLLFIRERRGRVRRQRLGGTFQNPRLRRIKAAQTGRQGREHHFAQRRLIVVRTKLAHSEPVRR